MDTMLHPELLASASTSLPLFGIEHLSVLGLTVLITTAMIMAARKRSADYPPIRKSVMILAWVLLLSHPAKVIGRIAFDLPLESNLWPMHLCNWAAVIGFFQ